MKLTSSFLARLPYPARAHSAPTQVLDRVLPLALLALLAVPAPVHAQVNVTYAQVWSQAAARADDGIGPVGEYTVEEDLHQTLGDFSGNLRAYQEAENIRHLGPDLAASAEAKLDYTAHASAQKFSATFSQQNYVDVDTAGGDARAFNSFYYLMTFEVVEAIGFHFVTSYAQGGNSFGHRLDFFKHNGGAVLDTPEVYYEPLDVTGVLLPGKYNFGYKAELLTTYDDLGSVRAAPGPTSLLLTFGETNPNPASVPDAGTTLALLGFGLAGLMATAKCATRISPAQ